MNKKFKAFYPNKLGKYLVLVGFGIYIISSLVKRLVDDHNIIWIMGLLGFFGLALAFGCLIAFGLCGIRYYGFSYKRVFLPIAGIVCCLGMVGLSAYTYQAIESVEEVMKQSGRISELKAVLDSGDLSNKKRIYASQLYAAWVYEESGIREEFLTKDGSTKIYQPTDEDIEFRAKREILFQVLDYKRTGAIRAVYLWLFILLVSVILGVKVPVAKKRKVAIASD